MIGRLKPGLSRAQAQAAVDVLGDAARSAVSRKPNKTVRARVIPERLARPEANSADQTPVVAGVFLVLVGLVLLVACVNVDQPDHGARDGASARDRGARRARRGATAVSSVRLLTESVHPGDLLGGVAGAVVGTHSRRADRRHPAAGDLPFRFDLTFDWRVFGYIAAIALAAGVGVGLLPALRASRTDLNAVLREGGRGTSEGGALSAPAACSSSRRWRSRWCCSSPRRSSCAA